MWLTHHSIQRLAHSITLMDSQLHFSSAEISIWHRALSAAARRTAGKRERNPSPPATGSKGASDWGSVCVCVCVCVYRWWIGNGSVFIYICIFMCACKWERQRERERETERERQKERERDRERETERERERERERNRAWAVLHALLFWGPATVFQSRVGEGTEGHGKTVSLCLIKQVHCGFWDVFRIIHPSHRKGFLLMTLPRRSYLCRCCVQ